MTIHHVFNLLRKSAVDAVLVFCRIRRNGLSLWNGVTKAGCFFE